MIDMIATPAASFTRPANTTAYASGDLVANSTTAGEVNPLAFSVAKLGSGRGKIKRVRLFKDNQTVSNANFTLHLFTEAPTVSNGDNGSFEIDTAENWLGSIGIDLSSGGLASTGDAIEAADVSPDILFDLGGQNRGIYGFLEAEAAYTPASGETFTVTLEIEG